MLLLATSWSNCSKKQKEKKPEIHVSIYAQKSHYYTPPGLYKVLQEKKTPKTSGYSRRNGSKKGITIRQNKKKSSIDPIYE
jgi:hypothetical protein